MSNYWIILIFITFSSSAYCEITPAEMARNVIQTKDLDGDGGLCKFECSDDLLSNFNLIDLNSDKFLSEEELVSYYTPKRNSVEKIK